MADTTKKRKRNVEAGAKASKKVAIEAPATSNVHFLLRENKGPLAPVVAVTPGFSVPKDITLQPYSKSRKNAPSRPGFSGAIATEEHLLHSNEHPKLDYTAREESNDGPDSLLKHYVAVYDPQTGKLEVMEARKMTVRGVVRAQQAAPEAMKENKSASSIWAQRNDLGQTFGTKKAKKAIASLTENAIAPGAAAGGERVKMDTTANVTLNTIGTVAAGMSTRDELQATADSNKPRPQANLEASHVKEVYTPESLVGADVLKVLAVNDWARAVKNNEEIQTKSRFVSRRIVDAAQDTSKLKCLRFALALLAFLSAGKGRGRSANRTLPPRTELREKIDLPETAIDSIRRRFSERGEMTKFHVDLLITHLCALALVIDNFEVDMYDLGEDLKMESKELSQYFLEVGATVGDASEKMRKQMGWDKSVAAQRKFAKLKLPLKFPKTRFMRRK